MAKIFGQTPNGENVYRTTISGGGLSANILTYGGIVQDLRLEGYDEALVLGFPQFQPYLDYPNYFGALVGRCANRIANGRFELDGETYQLDQNEGGKHTLHGGSNGVNSRNWTLAEHTENAVTLTLEDNDGEMGFPANVHHTCKYSLLEDGNLQVELRATTDAATIVNMAHHSYFTLDGAKDCRNTLLHMDADAYLPVDEELIPTGKIESVKNTAFDFRTEKPIGRNITGDMIYDHNFCTARARSALRPVASARDADSSVTMTVLSTEPGLQLYCADQMNIPVNGHSNALYHPYCGFALEAQGWPDAINNPEFPSVVLRPGQVQEQVTQFRFKREN